MTVDKSARVTCHTDWCHFETLTVERFSKIQTSVLAVFSVKSLSVSIKRLFLLVKPALHRATVCVIPMWLLTSGH